MYLPAQCHSINFTYYICFSGSRIYLPAQCRSINFTYYMFQWDRTYLPAQCRSINFTYYICFSGSRMYLPAQCRSINFTYSDNEEDLQSLGLYESVLAQGNTQGSGLHRLEKYLNIQDCLEKSLKIKFALKST